MEFVSAKVEMIQCNVQEDLLCLKFPDIGHSDFRLLQETSKQFKNIPWKFVIITAKKRLHVAKGCFNLKSIWSVFLALSPSYDVKL